MRTRSVFAVAFVSSGFMLSDLGGWRVAMRQYSPAGRGAEALGVDGSEGRRHKERPKPDPCARVMPATRRVRAGARPRGAAGRRARARAERGRRAPARAGAVRATRAP